MTAMSQNKIDGSLIGPVVGGGGERASQSAERKSGQLVPAVSNAVVLPAGVHSVGTAATVRQPVGGGEEKSGCFWVGRVWPDAEVFSHCTHGPRPKHAETGDTGFSSGEPDDARLQVNSRDWERSNVAGQESAIQSEKSSSAVDCGSANCPEGGSKLVRGIRLVSLCGAVCNGAVGRFFEVGSEIPRMIQQPSAANSWACPPRPGFDVYDFSANARRGAFDEAVLRISREIVGANLAGGTVWTGNIHEPVDHRYGVIVCSSGELAGDAGCQSLPEPGPISLGQTVEGKSSGAHPPDAIDSGFLVSYLDQPFPQQPGGGLNRAGLADVSSFSINRLVPAVSLGAESVGGAQEFIVPGELGQPVGQLHGSSYRSILQDPPCHTPQITSIGGNAGQFESPSIPLKYAAFLGEEQKATGRARSDDLRFTKPSELDGPTGVFDTEIAESVPSTERILHSKPTESLDRPGWADIRCRRCGKPHFDGECKEAR